MNNSLQSSNSELSPVVGMTDRIAETFTGYSDRVDSKELPPAVAILFGYGVGFLVPILNARQLDMVNAPVRIDNPSASRPLVSNTSILLFSAFLAGLAFGQILPRAAQFHAFAASAAGTVAYIGLWYSTRIKEQQDVDRINRQVTRRLERKLGKHVSTRRQY